MEDGKRLTPLGTLQGWLFEEPCAVVATRAAQPGARKRARGARGGSQHVADVALPTGLTSRAQGRRAAAGRAEHFA